MDYIAPVIDKNNSVTAILILRINPDTYLYPLIKEWPVPGKTSETLIVRKENENVLYLNELNNRSRTALNLEIPFTAKKVPAVQAALGRKGIFEGISYHGTNVLSYISPVSGTPWIIIAQIDDNEIYAQLYFKEIVIISFTVLVIIILTGGLVWYFHYRQKNIYRELFIREKELREHHEEFRTILYSIGDGVLTVDINGRIKNMNNTAEKLTGWNEQDAKNKLFEEVFKIINEETRNIVENPVKKVFSMGISAGLANHTILISRNGEEIPIADSAAPIHNELGEIIGVVLVFRDKIEEHKADKIIHESEARLKRAELISKSGNWELHLDSQLMHYSEGAEKIYGISKGSLYYETIKSNALPEYRAMLDEARKNLIENNQAYNVEYKIKTADTGEIKYIHSMAEFDSKRKILLGVIQDITERKVTEDILHESEDRFRAVYNASPSAISISEIETGKLIEINEAYEKLFGFSRDEAIGKSSLELGEWVNTDDRKAVIDTILKNKIYRNLEIKFKTKNNSIIDCLLSGGIIRTKNKNFMITIVHDITDLQNAALVIKESEERFRKIFEEHSAVKLLIDFATGNIVDANKTAVEYYGWTKDELLRMNIAEINTLPAEEIKIKIGESGKENRKSF